MVKLLNIALSVTFVSSLVSALPVQERQEMVDEFLGRTLQGGSDFEARDLDARALKLPANWQTIAKTVGITLAAQAAAFGGWKATKESQDAHIEVRSFNDLETRGKKIDYAYMAAITVGFLNAIRGPPHPKTRDFDESIDQNVEYEKRLNTAASMKWAAGILATAFAGGSVAKNIATRQLEDIDVLNSPRDEFEVEAHLESRSLLEDRSLLEGLLKDLTSE